MREVDALAIKGYLLSLEPMRRPNRAHDLTPPFGWRALLHLWRLLFFEPGAWRPDPARSEGWNRGAYLVGLGPLRRVPDPAPPASAGGARTRSSSS